MACILAKNYTDQLNVYGIITLNAPLTGTPILKRSYRDVKNFIANADKGLRLICDRSFQVSLLWKWQMYCAGLLAPWLLATWFPFTDGAKYIVPDSACMQEVYRFFYDGVHRIPCLLIAGYQNDFKELFGDRLSHHHSMVLAASNGAYAELITGDRNELHDTLIPLRSQLCSGDTFPDLVASAKEELTIMSMDHCSHFQCNIYNHITHAGNIIVIDPGLYVYGREPVLYAKRVLGDLIKFIQEKVEKLGCVGIGREDLC